MCDRDSLASIERGWPLSVYHVLGFSISKDDKNFTSLKNLNSPRIVETSGGTVLIFPSSTQVFTLGLSIDLAVFAVAVIGVGILCEFLARRPL